MTGHFKDILSSKYYTHILRFCEVFEIISYGYVIWLIALVLHSVAQMCIFLVRTKHSLLISCVMKA